MEKNERMMAEAIRRMKILHLHKNVIKEFESDERILNKSEGYGALYWLDEEEKKMVADFEETSGAIVYTCILTCMEFGECLSLLFVPNDEAEWEMDRTDIEEGYAFAYVINKTYPQFTEYGTIGVKSQYGGLVRTA